MTVRTTHTLKTGKEGLSNITATVKEAIRKSGVDAGLCVVYCPHTTAGITINENADPDVSTICCSGWEKPFPTGRSFAMPKATARHI